MDLREIYDLPLLELIYRAAKVHRKYHNGSEVQVCQLISIKTGGCPEDCKYCAQSSRYNSELKAEPLMELDEVERLINDAEKRGATRVCLGAAWRQVRDSKQFDRVLKMVEAVSASGMEACCTLGMLTRDQARRLKQAGLYAYNHNLDTSQEHYDKVITSRTYEDRLKTHEHVRDADLQLCSGGIIGLGESVEDRVKMIETLAAKDPQPESVPINRLLPMPGTPLGDQPMTTAWDLIRTIATARIAMPRSMVRLSAGREKLSIAEQGLCFLAGANSIFVGEKLLTAPNTTGDADVEMMETLGLTSRPARKLSGKRHTMEEALATRKDEGNLRSLRNGEGLIDLTSNDYLGFARSIHLSEQIEKEYRGLVHEEGIRPILGATGSRLLTGNSPYSEMLEQKICDFHGEEAGLLFNSGYLANLGLLSAVAKEGDTLIFDAEVHASTWDGSKLSGAHQMIFRHNDCNSLERQLKKAMRRGGEVFVAIESLYSMSGDIAPVREIAELCQRFDAQLIIDEAHATGIFEPSDVKVFARMRTFGKALGTHGAIVLGSKTLKEYLLNFSRPLIYTTAFPLHTLVSISCVYDRLADSDRDRRRLEGLITYFALRTHDLPIKATPTPIQSILTPHAVHLSQILREEGLDVRPILPPTVRRGQERLRVCLHTFNRREEIDRLIDVLTGQFMASGVA